MNIARKSIVAILSIFAALILCFSHFVWFPDLFKTQKNVLATLVNVNGTRIVVKQWWNKVDFYSVELEHMDENGRIHVSLIDGDSPKWWNCRLNLSNSIVSVIHGAEIAGSYDLKNFTLTRANGVKVVAD